MKVAYNIYLDAEEEIAAVQAMRDALVARYEDVPRWFFIQEEWNTYICKRTTLDKRLRKLQASIGYNISTVD